MSPSIANLKADLSKPRSYWIRYRAPDDWWSGCQLAWCRRWVGVAIKNIILYAWKRTKVMINLHPCYVHVCLMSFPVIDHTVSSYVCQKFQFQSVCFMKIHHSKRYFTRESCRLFTVPYFSVGLLRSSTSYLQRRPSWFSDVPSLTWGRVSNLLGGGGSPPHRAIIPDAHPLGTSENQDGCH